VAGASIDLTTSASDLQESTMKVPGPDHPITLTENLSRIVVKAGGKVIADTRAAVTLREANYPPVYYIPLDDVALSQLVRTDHKTHCPYKGDASYYSIPAGGDRAKNAVWSYENPYPAVIQIKDHVAFYPDRVDSIEENPLA
jgi:uncharacterized protein (DUF427 family)